MHPINLSWIFTVLLCSALARERVEKSLYRITYMSACFSLSSPWLPRTIVVQRIFYRSAFSSTSTTQEKSSSHRSASRFSLKVARFLFNKDRLAHSASFSTHPHHTKSETPGDIHEIAREFVFSLEPGAFKSAAKGQFQLNESFFRSSTNSY